MEGIVDDNEKSEIAPTAEASEEAGAATEEATTAGYVSHAIKRLQEGYSYVDERYQVSKQLVEFSERYQVVATLTKYDEQYKVQARVGEVQERVGERAEEVQKKVGELVVAGQHLYQSKVVEPVQQVGEQNRKIVDQAVDKAGAVAESLDQQYKVKERVGEQQTKVKEKVEALVEVGQNLYQNGVVEPATLVSETVSEKTRDFVGQAEEIYEQTVEKTTEICGATAQKTREMMMETDERYKISEATHSLFTKVVELVELVETKTIGDLETALGVLKAHLFTGLYSRIEPYAEQLVASVGKDKSLTEHIFRDVFKML